MIIENKGMDKTRELRKARRCKVQNTCLHLPYPYTYPVDDECLSLRQDNHSLHFFLYCSHNCYPL